LGKADEVRQATEARALGAAAAAEYDNWQHTLAPDATDAQAVTQPKDITRFAAAEFSWVGGNNYVDNPAVRIERLVDGRWVTYADQTGEVQTRVVMPTGVTSLVTQHLSPFAYRWTANFEAADFFPRDIDPRGPNIPDGTYRFAVDGQQFRDGAHQPYHLESRAFAVTPWRGVRVNGVRIEKKGTVAVDIAPIAYPRTYSSSFKVVADDKAAPICKTCTFRPWASGGEVHSVRVHIIKARGRNVYTTATRGRDGVWRTKTKLSRGDRVLVDAGGVVDSYGERNGAPSATVKR
jgi:hypothetical protein